MVVRDVGPSSRDFSTGAPSDFKNVRRMWAVRGPGLVRAMRAWNAWPVPLSAKYRRKRGGVWSRSVVGAVDCAEGMTPPAVSPRTSAKQRFFRRHPVVGGGDGRRRRTQIVRVSIQAVKHNIGRSAK